MAELVDAVDSKSTSFAGVLVRFRLGAPFFKFPHLCDFLFLYKYCQIHFCEFLVRNF